MSEQGQRIRIRLFILSSLGLLVTLAVFLLNWPKAVAQGAPAGDAYVVQFDDATGIAAGSPVRLSGVKIGKVEKVELNDMDGKVKVTVRINPGFKIRKHHVPTIVTNFPAGEATVDLLPKETKPGQPVDRNPVDPKTVLLGESPTNVRRLVDRGSVLADKSAEAVAKISGEIEKLRKSVDELLPTVKTTTKEIGDLAKDVRGAVPTIEATAKEMTELSKEVRRTMPTIESTVKEIGELSKAVRESVPELRKTTEAAQKLIKSANETVPLVRDVLSELKITARNWARVGERVNVFLATNEDALDDIVANVREAAKGAARLFGEDNQKAVSEVLTNLAPASKHFPEIARGTEAFVKEARGTLRRVEDSLTGFDRVMKNVGDLSDPNSEASKGMLKNVQQAAERLNAVLGDVQTLLSAAARKDGTLRRFLADPALYNHLDDAAVSVTRILPRLDRIMKDLEVFADKVARHPEAIGLGGLVRPDAGLKDSPARVWQPRR